MNFGLSRWNQPICEEHFHIPPRDDESVEENPNVEDLSIGGGEEKDLETVKSAAEISSGEKKGGGKRKGIGARSRREREGDKYLMIRS